MHFNKSEAEAGRQRRKKRRSASLNRSLKKLRVEKDGINKEQNDIKEMQGQLRQECEHLRQESIAVTRQSVNTQIRLPFMFQILKAREKHDFSQASLLMSALRELIAREK